MALKGILKQSTAVDLPIGPFLDETDGKTAETTLVLTQPDIRLKKNAGGWAQKNAAQTLSHEENGYYEVNLDATDTDTLGMLSLAVDKSGALPVNHDYLVVPADVYDMFFLYGLKMLGVKGYGTLGAGSTTSGTLAAEAGSTDDSVNGQTLDAIAGAGAGQTRNIVDFVGSTRVATLDPALATAFDNTTVYVRHGSPPAPTTVLPPVNTVAIEGKTLSSKTGENLDVFFHNGGNDSTVTQDDAAGAGASAADIAAAVADVSLASHTTAGSLGQRIGRIPNAAAGTSGGLPTVDASNQVNATLSSDERLAAADALLTRDMAAVDDSSGDRMPLDAFRAIRNKVSVAAGTVTITKEDDTTSAWTAAVTGTPAVTSVDPA